MENTLNWIFGAGMAAWVAGALSLAIYANMVRDRYLRQLPPVDGVPLNMYTDKGWLRGWRGPVWRAWRQPQADPELERLRQEGRRRSRYALAWMFGFPIVVVGATALLISTGVLR
jgi:hypothetical protein